MQPVQPPPASPGKSEKALIIKILDLSAADAAGAAGSARKKPRAANTTCKSKIIIILLKVADTSEAPLGHPLEAIHILDVARVARPRRGFKMEGGYPLLHLLQRLQLEKLQLKNNSLTTS